MSTVSDEDQPETAVTDILSGRTSVNRSLLTQSSEIFTFGGTTTISSSSASELTNVNLRPSSFAGKDVLIPSTGENTPVRSRSGRSGQPSAVQSPMPSQQLRSGFPADEHNFVSDGTAGSGFGGGSLSKNTSSVDGGANNTYISGW